MKHRRTETRFIYTSLCLLYVGCINTPKQEPHVADLKIGDEATDQGRDLQFGRAEPNTSD